MTQNVLGARTPGIHFKDLDRDTRYSLRLFEGKFWVKVKGKSLPKG